MNDEPFIAFKEKELKEDILFIQFKLVDKNSYRTINTFNFINIPLQKIHDNNVSTLLEIISKLKKMSIINPYINSKKNKSNS